MFFRFKKKSNREDDKIWATKALKLQGICEEILGKLEKNHPILVISHFEKSLEELKAILDERGVKYEVARAGLTELDLFERTEIKTTLLLSESISVPTQFNPLPGEHNPKEGEIHIIVAEHYPTPQRDQEVLSFAASLPCASTVAFHVSLDEPLLKMFGADSILGLLKKLGWDEIQYISHSSITSAITKAQKKIEKLAIGDQRVRSIEEWFAYNVPSS